MPKLLYKIGFPSLAVAIVLVMILTSLSTGTSFASEDIVTFEKGYNADSDTLYQMAQQLVNRYAFLLELEVIGESEDGKPIYAIRMTYNIFRYDAYDYVDKTHILIDGGVHARETYNPVIVLRMVEDYIKDYYNDSYLPDQNVRELLHTSVIHFLPIINPDGFDVAKFGTESISNLELANKFTSLIPDLRPNRLKANLSGVDLNRNFEDIYFDIEASKWIDLWGESGLYRDTDQPGEDYYKGVEATSEIETQTLMAYMLRYDFRAYLTYHSMGQVIYYWIDHLGAPYYALNKDYAEKISAITGYALMVPDKYMEYGFSTDYFANNTTKPAITLETTSSFVFPTPLSFYSHEYYAHRLWEVPLAVLNKIKSDGYYDYKIYVDNRYVRDVISDVYAKAIAKELNGAVHEYKGKPSLTLSKKIKLELGNDYYFEDAVQSEALKVFVSFREAFAQMGFDISYDATTNSAIATHDSKAYKLDLKEMRLTDEEGKLINEESVFFVLEGRVMVPLEFAAALMNQSVEEINIQDLGKVIYVDLDH